MVRFQHAYVAGECAYSTAREQAVRSVAGVPVQDPAGRPSGRCPAWPLSSEHPPVTRPPIRDTPACGITPRAPDLTGLPAQLCQAERRVWPLRPHWAIFCPRLHRGVLQTRQGFNQEAEQPVAGAGNCGDLICGFSLSQLMPDCQQYETLLPSFLVLAHSAQSVPQTQVCLQKKLSDAQWLPVTLSKPRGPPRPGSPGCVPAALRRLAVAHASLFRASPSGLPLLRWPLLQVTAKPSTGAV